MPIFGKLLGGGITEIVDSVSNVVDKFTLSKEEKQAFKLEMQSQLMQVEQELEATYRTEIESRSEIIKAEMAQGDSYTKRARPTIIYVGLIFIFIVYVLVPVIAYISGASPKAMPKFDLPTEFWWAWGTVVSVYGAGRSAEKMGIVNSVTNLATGSGLNKAVQNNKSVG